MTITVNVATSFQFTTFASFDSRYCSKAQFEQEATSDMARRSFSSLRAKDALDLVPSRDVTSWDLRPAPHIPSDVLLALLDRAQSFALTASDAAKLMLIDFILLEMVPNYPTLKVWKEEFLEVANINGIAHFLIALKYGYVQTPLLCAIEAKLDDFAAGEIQCIAEMAACRDINLRDGHGIEIHGIVSNGQGWVFYRLTRTPEVLVSGLFTMNDLPKLLGALDHVCAACAANIPRQ